MAADRVRAVACPVCGAHSAELVLDLGLLPVNLNAQVPPGEAARVARGPVRLAVCTGCSHLYNAAFDPALIDYDESYENSLYFSPRFRQHASALAARLVEQYRLTGRTVVEVGCGPGHFLSLLCENGAGRGLGYDPSFDPERLEAPHHSSVDIVAGVLSSQSGVTADLACSLQVLEHVESPVGLLQLLGDVVGGGVVFTEVPNGEYMLDNTALWDLLYEHVSYFTPASLELALARAGLELLGQGSSFGGQFLWADASSARAKPNRVGGALVDDLIERARRFGVESQTRIDSAAAELDTAMATGPVALWGAGTKGMTYLNLVAGADRIAAVVDVNPRKHGFGVPGTHLAVTGPERLTAIGPTTVLAANPIYRDEIRQQLRDLGVRAEVVPLWCDEPDCPSS